MVVFLLTCLQKLDYMQFHLFIVDMFTQPENELELCSILCSYEAGIMGLACFPAGIKIGLSTKAHASNYVYI